MRGMIRFVVLTAVGLIFAVGVGVAASPQGGEEADIKTKFKELQDAIKGKDGDKIWSQLSSNAQAMIEKIAKDAQTEFGKLDAGGKKKLSKESGLPEATLSKMSAQDYFKSQAFKETYANELPGSKFDKVVIQGDKATLHYIEEDNDKRTLNYVRQDKVWKADISVNKLR